MTARHALSLEHRRPLQGLPTVVYRFYDVDDRLLYVGITCEMDARRHAHELYSRWWRFVSREEVEHHPNRPAALAAEYEAIQAERPVFNVVGHPGKPVRR